MFCITEDRWGRIYAGTGHGVDRLDPLTGRVKHYTMADGLVRGDANVAGRDRDGALWFGSPMGLSRLDPEPDHKAQPAPILITGIEVRGVPQALGQLGAAAVSGLALRPEQNQLRIDFVGIGFSPGERLRYQYRLEGADRDWSPPAEQRSINFASLRPGSYTFYVRAVNAEGVQSPNPAVVSFTVLAPIWQRWWFVSAAAIALALLAYGAYRFRLSQLLSVERIRTRIATDLHDDIGSSLSQIAILSELAQRKLEGADPHAAGPLADIATVARELVDGMSDIVWAINPKHDHLSNLTRRMRRFAGDVLEARNIALEFRGLDTQPDLRVGADFRRQVFLIFKEAINNIVRHSDSTRAEVEFGADARLSSSASLRQWQRLHPNWRRRRQRAAEHAQTRRRPRRPRGAEVDSEPRNHNRNPGAALLPILVGTSYMEIGYARDWNSRKVPETASPVIRVTVIEDQRRIRDGLAALIGGSEGYSCCGAFASMEEALARTWNEVPDVALVDIGLPGMSGIDGIRLLRQKYPSTIPVMLSVYEDDQRIFDALCAGACGYLLKKTPPARLLEYIKDVTAGGAPMSPEVARRVIGVFRSIRPTPASSHDLTPHEFRLLKMLVDGHNYRSAAEEMGVSFNTIAFHMRNIYQKLQVHSKSEAVAKALKNGLIG